MAVFFVILTLFTVGIITFVFGSGILNGLLEATEGIVQRSLIPNALIIFVFVYGLLIIYAKLGPRDLGLEREKVLQAVSIVALIIIVLQITSTIMTAISGNTITLGSLWSKVSGSTAIGILICQLFAVAVQEEIIFRGFLIPQVYLRVKANNNIPRIGLSLVISQGLFAIWHIPIRIFSGMSPMATVVSIITVFMLGIIFALIYIRTDNIFIVMGMHGLWNTVQATAESGVYALILMLIMSAMIFQGPRLQKLNKEIDNLPNTAGSL